MPSQQLQKRINEFNTDYRKHTGQWPTAFFCPIRHVDEPGEIIQGHVIGQTLPNCSRRWVPQRGDVDGVFGSIEAEFHRHFAARTDDYQRLFADKKLHKQVRPKMELEGVELDYFVRPASNGVTGDGEEVEIVAKVPRELAGDRDEFDVQTVIERDDQAVALMVALHSAHLTMFYLNGYEYALSSGGKFVADVLNDFYKQGTPLSRRERVDLAAEYYPALRFMHAPLQGGITSDLLGTVEDRKFLLVFDEQGTENALGVVVRFQEDRIAAFLPLSAATEQQYFDQLDGKCQRLFVKLAQLVGEGLRIDRIDLAPGEPGELRFIT